MLLEVEGVWVWVGWMGKKGQEGGSLVDGVVRCAASKVQQVGRLLWWLVGVVCSKVVGREAW